MEHKEALEGVAFLKEALGVVQDLETFLAQHLLKVMMVSQQVLEIEEELVAEQQKMGGQMEQVTEGME